MRCIALFSGGLDSMIAIRLMREQGIEVVALHINTGFGDGGDKKAALMRQRAQIAGGEYLCVDVSDDYLKEVLFNPKFGYGKHFNPCIDCHGYMFKIALLMMKELGASFLVTGEVLGERPMSQRSEALNQVLRLAGDDEGLILRPLSAKLMKPTKPEIMGWVDKNALLDISGRGRKRQFELAKIYNFSDYETPGGGCLLTLEAFSKKIKDHRAHEGAMDAKDVALLKLGRHLRLPDGAKMIIGKDEGENDKILSLLNDKFTLIKIDIIGATSIISTTSSAQDEALAAKLALTYSKANSSKSYDVFIADRHYNTKPFESKLLAHEYFVI